VGSAKSDVFFREKQGEGREPPGFFTQPFVPHAVTLSITKPGKLTGPGFVLDPRTLVDDSANGVGKPGIANPVEGRHGHCKFTESIFCGRFKVNVTGQAFDFGILNSSNLKPEIQGFVFEYPALGHSWMDHPGNQQGLDQTRKTIKVFYDFHVVFVYEVDGKCFV